MKTIICLLLLSVLVISCDSGKNHEFDSFFDQPTDVRKNSFKKMSFDQQYKIYVDAMTNRRRHPPNLYYADEIAAEGKLIVPALIKKLKNTKDEEEQALIFYLFEIMSTYCCYNLTSDKEIISYLKSSPLSMKDDYFRQKVNKSLTAILTESVDRSPQGVEPRNHPVSQKPHGVTQ